VLAVVLLIAVFFACVGREYEIGKGNTMSDEGEVEDGTTKGSGLAGRIVTAEREPIQIDGTCHLLLLARSCIRITRGVHIPRCVLVQAVSFGEVKAAGA